MDVRRRQPIGVELVKRGVVTEQDIEEALQYQRKHPNMRLGDILYVLKACDEEVLIRAIGDILGEKGIILKPYDIKLNLTDYISLEVAKKNKAIPFDIENGKIKICFSETSNNKAMETIRLLMLNKGLIMDSYITFESDILKYLKSSEGEASDNLNISGQGNTITELIDNI